MKNLFKFYPIVIFLIIYLIYSLSIYKLVPITTDEEARYYWGRDLLGHYKNSGYLQSFFKPDQEPDTNILYPTILNIFNPDFYYEWFHLQNLLFSSVAFIAVYFLIFLYTREPKASILGPIFLFLTPNFSGFLGNNPIDTPFAVVFILNILLVYYFRNKGFNFAKVFVLGFSFWPLLSIRPVGAQIFLHFIVLTLLFLPKTDRIKYLLDELKNIILIGFVSFFLMVITWPYLAINFFKNYYSILLTNASYDKWNNTILFEGAKIPGLEAPWYYLFTYLAYTIPFFILFLFVFAIFKNYQNKLKVFILYIILFNLSLYLLLDPVIYNGMRHFLFLMPMIVTIATFGFFDLLKSKLNQKIKIIFFIGIFSSIVWTLYEIVNLFPNQYAYFNEISGGFRNNYLKYETEYWGGSYKFATEYIRENIAPNYNDLKVSSCFIGFGVQYYAQGKFRHVIRQSEGDLLICDVVSEMGIEKHKLGEIVHQINIHGIPFINIRKNK